MSVYLVLAVLLLAVIAAVVIRAERLRDIREERREAEFRAAQEAELRARQEAERRALALARHPSRRQVLRRMVPGLCPDGEPLNEEDLQKYTELMFRESAEQGNQARENSAEEGTA